jgi:hypothetical protein
VQLRLGVLQMAKRPDAEVLEYILMNLRLLAFKAQETDFGSLSSMLEVAVMEAEFRLSSAQHPDALGEFSNPLK